METAIGFKKKKPINRLEGIQKEGKLLLTNDVHR